MTPRGEEPPVEVRLLRPYDLIDLRLEGPGCTVEPTEGGAELVAGVDASLIVHFPPQHVGEEVWQAGAPPPPPAQPLPGLRQPGRPDPLWRVLVEEHELLDADPAPGERSARVPRLVYADSVAL